MENDVKLKMMAVVGVIALLTPVVALAAPGNSGNGGNNGSNGQGSGGQGQGGGVGNGGTGSNGNGGGNGGGGNGGNNGGNGGGNNGGGNHGGGEGGGHGGGSTSGSGAAPSFTGGVIASGGTLIITGGQGISKAERSALIDAVRACEQVRPGLALGDTTSNGGWSFRTYDDTVWPYVQRCMAGKGYPANGTDFTN